MSAAPRTREQRRRDTEERLAADVDVWVATAFEDGTPYLVPLSFEWDGEIAVDLASGTAHDLVIIRRRDDEVAAWTKVIDHLKH